ncbi:hypothetical protein Tco_0267060 [Tanacetum coccineum]
MGVSHDLRGDSWGCVPRSLFWREDLDKDGECGFDYLTLALVSSKAHHKGVGLRVADSHTGNHSEGGFTPPETVRRLLVVIGRISYSGFEGEAFKPRDKGTSSALYKTLFTKASFGSSRLLLLRRMMSCLRLLLPFGSDDSLCRRPGSTLGGIPRGTLLLNQSQAEGSNLWGMLCLYL